MKKSFLILLMIIIIIISASSVFAADSGEETGDALVPAAPVENVDAAVYDEMTREIDDTDIPTVLIDEPIPQGGSLPKTGGIPAEAFYVGGGLFVAAAVILARKKTK